MVIMQDEKSTSGEGIEKDLKSPPNTDVILDVGDVPADLSFRAVTPVNVQAQGLNVNIDTSPTTFNPLAFLRRSTPEARHADSDKYKKFSGTSVHTCPVELSPQSSALPAVGKPQC